MSKFNEEEFADIIECNPEKAMDYFFDNYDDESFGENDKDVDPEKTIKETELFYEEMEKIEELDEERFTTNMSHSDYIYKLRKIRDEYAGHLEGIEAEAHYERFYSELEDEFL